jgi:hypothetical protein
VAKMGEAAVVTEVEVIGTRERSKGRRRGKRRSVRGRLMREREIRFHSVARAKRFKNFGTD